MAPCIGTVVCAGGGVGVAPMLPIVQALKAAGNRVITVLAGQAGRIVYLYYHTGSFCGDEAF